MRRAPELVLLLALAAPGAGCARGPGELVPVRPAPAAATGPAAAAAAATVAAREVAGIGVIVTGAAWDGYPAAAATGRITPVQITLENHSGHAILVRYRDVALVGASGQRYAALPPTPPVPPRDGTQVFAPAFSSYGFGVAPDLRLYYPTFPVAYDPCPTDRAGQQAAFATWPAGLPTQDMRDHALPEGVLLNRGRVTGVLYFPAVGSRESRVSFQAHVVGSPRGDELAIAALDFRVR